MDQEPDPNTRAGTGVLGRVWGTVQQRLGGFVAWWRNVPVS